MIKKRSQYFLLSFLLLGASSQQLVASFFDESLIPKGDISLEKKIKNLLSQKKISKLDKIVYEKGYLKLEFFQVLNKLFDNKEINEKYSSLLRKYRDKKFRFEIMCSKHNFSAYNYKKMRRLITYKKKSMFQDSQDKKIVVEVPCSLFLISSSSDRKPDYGDHKISFISSNEECQVNYPEFLYATNFNSEQFNNIMSGPSYKSLDALFSSLFTPELVKCVKKDLFSYPEIEKECKNYALFKLKNVIGIEGHHHTYMSFTDKKTEWYLPFVKHILIYEYAFFDTLKKSHNLLSPQKKYISMTEEDQKQKFNLAFRKTFNNERIGPLVKLFNLIDFSIKEVNIRKIPKNSSLNMHVFSGTNIGIGTNDKGHLTIGMMTKCEDIKDLIKDYNGIAIDPEICKSQYTFLSIDTISVRFGISVYSRVHSQEELCANCNNVFVNIYGKKVRCCSIDINKPIYYCSRSCQKKHWKKVHRKQCTRKVPIEENNQENNQENRLIRKGISSEMKKDVAKRNSQKLFCSGCSKDFFNVNNQKSYCCSSDTKGPVHYCSKDCQRNHWSVHRNECKKKNSFPSITREQRAIDRKTIKIWEKENNEGSILLSTAIIDIKIMFDRYQKDILKLNPKEFNKVHLVFSIFDRMLSSIKEKAKFFDQPHQKEVLFHALTVLDLATMDNALDQITDLDTNKILQDREKCPRNASIDSEEVNEKSKQIMEESQYHQFFFAISFITQRIHSFVSK